MFSMIQVSLLADLCLGGILVLMWSIRRRDQHALYWGAGQIMLGVTAALWGLNVQTLWMPPLITTTCAIGLMGLIVGTLHFCGRPLHWGLNLAGWAIWVLFWSVAYSARLITPEVGYPIGLATYASVFTWCGWRLTSRPLPYRVLGLIFFLRALAHLGLAINMFSSEDLDIMLIIDFVLEMGTALGMIHALLYENDERIRIVLDDLGHGFLIRDAEGTIRFASKKLASLVGLECGTDLIGQNIAMFTPSRPPERTAEWFNEVTAPDASLPCIDETRCRRKGGVESPIEIISVPFDDRGQTLVLSQVIDISKRIEQDAALHRAAMLDDLTGLFNRGTMRQMLRGLLSGLDGHATILLLIDLDHFKRINDTLGHSVGDKLLKLVAERLKGLQGSHDVLARFGGDEFVLVVSEQDPATVQEEAERLARVILLALSKPFTLDSSRITLKASIGIAFGPTHGLNPETLLSAADTALYAAKDAGRNRWSVFDPAMIASSRNALLIDEALQQAIANNEFKLVYQPIVDARSRHLCKVEALLRWTTPSLGFVGPDRFIPIAEESGQIIEIGNWVLQEAARQARIWAEQPEGPIRIAVNVSAAQLVAPDFMSIVDETLQHSGAAPTEIEIEMTERVLIDEADTVVRVIEELHTKGLSTSLDDFGTGYSSLSYLTRFHLRTLKIDRAFVNGIEHDKRNLALVRAIIAMGHSLNMQIVAEGVETEEQAVILADLGCEYLQGYLFSRPVPAEQIRPNQA